jgi:hypothetical protein
MCTPAGVVGWSIADHLRTELVLDALDMARWRRKPAPGGTVLHADHGCQGGFNWSSQHLVGGGVVRDDAGAAAAGSVVSRADSLSWPADGGLTDVDRMASFDV